MNRLKPHTGQSLTEYILIGSLIAIVALGGLAVLGNSISLSFKNLISGERKELPPVNSHLLAISAASTGGNGGTVSGGGNASVPDTAKDCVADGFCFDFSKIEASEKSMTQTTGANGDLIAGYSDVLEQVLARVEKMPDADPTLRQYIINSANSGHDIVNHYDLGSSGNVSQATISFIFRSDDLRSYINQHPNVLPTEVNEVIKLSLNNIQKISVGHLKKSLPNYYEFYQIPPNLQVSTDEEFSLTDFSKKVKKNANTVCKAGKADPDCTQ